MRKILPVFFSFVYIFVFSLNPVLSFAQEPEEDMISAEEKMSAQSVDGVMPEQSSRIVPPYPGGKPLPFAGENHAYSVVLRGNGEAIVTLKVALTNTNADESSLDRVTMRLPLRIIPSDISVYQIITQGYCTRYDDRQYIQGQTELYYPRNPRCIEYSDPDYYNYYGGGKYQRAKFEYSGDTLVINLPTAIQAEKTGAFFVYFRAMGYAKRNLSGAFKFNFESLKTNNPVNQMNIGISTDSDLYLKGSKGQVDYRFEDAGTMMKMEARSGVAAPMTSSAIDRVVSQTGQGTIVKTASNLAPLESYKVSGMYANSKIKLYGKEIMVAIAILLFIAAVIFMLIRKFVGMMGQQAPLSGVKTTVKSGPVVQNNSDKILTSLGLSFISSIILAGWSFLLLILFNNLNYGYIDYQAAQLLRIASLIFSFFIYSVGLFIPGLYYGHKKGVSWGIVTVVMTVGLLFIYFVIGVAIVFFFGNQTGNSVVPMMEKLQR